MWLFGISRYPILFALGIIETGFVQDIVDVLKDKMDEDEDVIFKKVTTTASAMKTKKILGAKAVGIRSRYYIKY